MSTLIEPTILIVDDSQTTRSMIKRVVKMIDFPIGQMLEAENGAEGLKCMERTQVDLVLADLNMPVMDGFEMIERMRRDPKTQGIPVVVISAQPDPEQVALLKRHGVAGYLQKPFTAEDVRNIVLPLLEAVERPHLIAVEGQAPINLTLAEALSSALETMAFITPDLITTPELPPLSKDARLVRVDFKGKDTAGSLCLAASPDFGNAMAANLDDTTATAGDDALKELANVTCGLLLRMRPGGGVGFHLAPPHLSWANAVEPKTVFKTGDLIAFQADGQVITAQVITDAAFYGA